MTVASLAHPSVDLQSLVETIAPGKIRFNPFGMVSGYKAYLIYTGLAAKSDEELAELGLARSELPQLALRAAA
jgi:hypothetical protein